MELFSYFARLLKTHPANLHRIDSFDISCLVPKENR